MAGNDCEDNDIGDGFNECPGSEQTLPFKLKVPSKAIDPMIPSHPVRSHQKITTKTTSRKPK